MDEARSMSLRTSIAALVASTCLVATATASAEVARPADAFVDSIGVNTHINYEDTAYGDFDGVRARLRELGVRHIRDGVCGVCDLQQDRLVAVGRDGIKMLAGAGRPDDRGGTLDQDLAVIRTKLRFMVDGIEGPNEWDLFSGRTPDWASQLRAYQRRLYGAVQDDPSLRTLPVVGPSLVFSWEQPSSWDILGNLSETSDVGNSHAYAGGRPPEVALDPELQRARQVSGSHQVYVTEAGYHNALAQDNNDHPPVPEDVAGSYIPRMFLDYFSRGVTQTYSYELADERRGSATTDQEQSFGLLHADLSRKPAFVALRNLITTLSDPGSAVGNAEVPIAVRGGDDLRHLLLRKRDGEIDVVLWRADSLWDPSHRRRFADDTASAWVDFAPTGDVRVVDPAVATAGRQVTPDGSSLRLAIGAAPVVVRYLPGQAHPTQPSPPQAAAVADPPAGAAPAASTGSAPSGQSVAAPSTLPLAPAIPPLPAVEQAATAGVNGRTGSSPAVRSPRPSGASCPAGGKGKSRTSRARSAARARCLAGVKAARSKRPAASPSRGEAAGRAAARGAESASARRQPVEGSAAPARRSISSR